MSNALSHLTHALLHPAVKSYARAHWSPPVDIYPTRAGWLVNFDLAGVARSDLQLAVAGRHLTVRGRRRDWCVEAGAASSARSMKITYSEFERTIELPGDAEHLRVITDYRDGTLLVQLVAQDEAP
jgi:HSP20 family molecular chaperone IbpA